MLAHEYLYFVLCTLLYLSISILPLQSPSPPLSISFPITIFLVISILLTISVSHGTMRRTFLLFYATLPYIRHFIFAGCYDNNHWYLVTNLAGYLDLAGFYFSKYPANSKCPAKFVAGPHIHLILRLLVPLQLVSTTCRPTVHIIPQLFVQKIMSSPHN
jgi:hypothetical protein